MFETNIMQPKYFLRVTRENAKVGFATGISILRNEVIL